MPAVIRLAVLTLLLCASALLRAQQVVRFPYQKGGQLLEAQLQFRTSPDDWGSLDTSVLEVVLYGLSWDERDTLPEQNLLWVLPASSRSLRLTGQRLRAMQEAELKLRFQVVKEGAGKVLLQFDVRDTAEGEEGVIGSGKQVLPFRVVAVPESRGKLALPSSSGISYALGSLLLLLLALGAWWGLRHRKNRRPPAQEETAAAEPQQPTPANTRQELVELSTPLTHYARTFEEVLQSDLYYPVELADCWADTAVAEVYMHRRFVAALNQFIRNENERFFTEEKGQKIPEIGGFMMGHARKKPGHATYQVALEWFVAIEAEKQDAYQIEFGRQAWYALTRAQDMLPGLQTIGWFHTHPGHGLFLSEPDLRIHTNFFPKPYQLAMEIDSHAPALDTAFFSQKNNGDINNRKDRIPGSDWLSWVEVDQWTRKTLQS
jgi:proteasome lid subunit RPN8/RPN11